jgi:hypothetical protein
MADPQRDTGFWIPFLTGDDEAQDILSPFSGGSTGTGGSIPAVNESGRKRVRSSAEISDGHDEEEDEDSQKRMRRARVACRPCRRAKQRCDNNRPCSRCVAKKREDQCQDPADAPDDNESSTVDFTEALDRFIKDFTPREIHDMILDRPFKWSALLGLFIRWTSVETCERLRCKLISEALCAGTVETIPCLTELAPLNPIHFQEFEYCYVESVDNSQDFLSNEEAEDLCQLYNVRSLDKSDIAIFKTIFFPHKDGARIRFYWNEAASQLIEEDFEKFHKTSLEKWKRLTSDATKSGGERARVPPIFWDVFTSKSYEKVLYVFLKSWIKGIHESFDQLDIQTFKSKKIIPCSVKCQTTLYPLFEIPQTICFGVKPLSPAYNPFVNKP